jgi:RimJ/RimL family protein N-acetyltransferase
MKNEEAEIPELETERLWMRRFTLDDAEDFLRLNSDPEVVRYVGREPLTSIEQAREMLQSAPLRDYRLYGFGRLACIEKQSGKLIGFAGLKFVEEIDEVDIGYRFLPQYWGCGLATESSIAVIDYGRNALDLKRIVGIVDPENRGSVKVLQKLGLKYERKINLSLTEVDLDLYA